MSCASVLQLSRSLLVGSSLDSASHNKAHLAELTEMFHEFDTKQDGRLTLDEVDNPWKDPAVKARFKLMGVEYAESTTLFDLLDVDGTKEIEIDEFVMGCLHCQRMTKPVDHQTYLKGTKRLNQLFSQRTERIESRLDAIQSEVLAVSKTRFMSVLDGPGVMSAAAEGTALAPQATQLLPQMSKATVLHSREIEVNSEWC